MLEYNLVERPAFKVVGKSKQYDFSTFKKDAKQDWKSYVTSQAYQSLMAMTDAKPGVVSNAPLMSVYLPLGNECDDTFIDLLGVELECDTDLQPYDSHLIPAATYAEFFCTYKTSMKTNRQIYGDWFDATGFERDKRKPDIAAYLPIPFKSMSDMIVRWWIPIVKHS